MLSLGVHKKVELEAPLEKFLVKVHLWMGKESVGEQHEASQKSKLPQIFFATYTKIFLLLL
jgi:hypothetical protein